MSPRTDAKDLTTGAISSNVGWFVFAIACSLRLFAAAYTGGLLHPEVFEYDSMARSLLAGQGLVYQHLNVPYYAFASPLYAWLSAVSYWLVGSLVLLMVFQVIAGSAFAVIGAPIASRLHSGCIAPRAG